MPTLAFKEIELSCLRNEERTAVFHSSGTTGHRPSRHFHNAESLAVYEASVLAGFPISPAPGSHLLLLSPSPKSAPNSSLAHMFDTIRQKFAAPESAFLGRREIDAAWTVDLEAAVAAFQNAAMETKPVVLLGTAFSFVHLLDFLAEKNLNFPLLPGSCAMETGGYKNRSRILPKAELHALISERLGIAPPEIICEYGMSELSSQAYDLRPDASRITLPGSRTFHFPPWCRAQVISPETDREVAEGETGLLRICDLANVFSVMAIQTEDLAIRRGDGFELIGRAEAAEPRGCSLMSVSNQQS